MSERKYIILQNDDTGKEYCIIFDRDLSHSAVAHGIMRDMGRNDWGPHMYLTPVSAGFIATPDTVIGGRGSESLKLGPRPEDQSLIRGEMRYPLIVSAADGPILKPAPVKPKRSLLERSKGARSR
jgi:hypothetical protein